MFNQDIKLKNMGNGVYDREFHINDFKTTSNLESLENKIIISLMTRLGELKTNPTYKSFGCDIYKYLKHNNTLLTQITIKESIKRLLESIEGIESVNYIQIETDAHNPYVMNIFFTLKTHDNTLINEKIMLRSI